MGKKEIFILIIVCILVTLTTVLTIKFISSDKTEGKNKTETKIESNSSLKVGNYTLEYGTYEGVESEYDYDSGKMKDKKMTIIINKDNTYSINGSDKQKFVVKGTKLYVNSIETIEVIGNNKISLIAGAGITLDYKK